MSIFLRATKLKLCVRLENGKEVSRSFSGKEPYAVLDDISKAAEIEPVVGIEREELVGRMYAAQHCERMEDPPSQNARLDRWRAWKRQGMPGTKYECPRAECEWIDGNTLDLYWHVLDCHGQSLTSKEAASCVSDTYIRGQLYFECLKDCAGSVCGAKES